MDLYDIGRQLSYTGASWAGKQPEWVIADTDRQKALEELDASRQKAMMMDMRGMRMMLEQQDFGGAQSLAQSRLEAINQLGGDPSHTAEVLRLMQEGNYEEAYSRLKRAEDIAVGGGILDPIAGPEVKIQGGQAITIDPITGKPSAVAIEGWDPALAGTTGGRPIFKVGADGNIYKYDATTDSWAQSQTGGATFNPGGATNVQVTMPGQTDYSEEQKQLARLRVERLGKMQEQADSALEQNVQLDQLSALDVESGWGTGAKTQTARVLNAVWPGSGNAVMKSVSAQEAFAAVSEELVTSKLNSATGPQTDQDAQRIRSTVATLGKTPDANAFIISAARGTNDRKIEQRNFYESYFERKGSLEGVDTEWAKYKLSTPMLSDPRYVRNKQTGLPIFYNEFYRAAKQGNPQLSDAEIVDKWRELNQPKGGEK